MKTFKKVLGVVLAIAMLTGVFSMMASALAPDSAVDLYISTDKSTYAPGDTIIITVSQQVESAVGDMTLAGQYPIGYPSAALQPYSTEKSLSAHNFTAVQAGLDESISDIFFDSDFSAGGVSVDAGAAWDAIFGLIVASDGTSFENTDKKDLFTFQMKVKDDAPDGTYTLGFNKDAYVQYWGFSGDVAMGGVYGYDDDYGYGTTANYGLGTCTFTVGSAPAGPKVAYYKAQLKMTPTSATTVADDFQFRVQSVITDADFDAYFANSADKAATTDAIKSMGIVAYKGAGAFDEATAKALVIDGTAATDYAAAETDYLSKASDTADGYFGAIIKAKHSTMPNDVTYMGFVKYVDAAGADQVIFYETTKTAAIASNYDSYVSAYLAANPYSA